MEIPKYNTALIVGAGEGLSASLARLFAREGIRVALAARRQRKARRALPTRPARRRLPATPTEPGDVERLFGAVEREIAAPDVVVYNASDRTRGPLIELDPVEVAKALRSALSAASWWPQAAQAHAAAQAAARSCSPAPRPASRAMPQSAPFAMGKFALRGLAQSMARELPPQGIHVAHFVIDGGIRSARRPNRRTSRTRMLDPDAIAASYWTCSTAAQRMDVGTRAAAMG